MPCLRSSFYLPAETNNEGNKQDGEIETELHLQRKEWGGNKYKWIVRRLEENAEAQPVQWRSGVKEGEEDLSHIRGNHGIIWEKQPGREWILVLVHNMIISQRFPSSYRRASASLSCPLLYARGNNVSPLATVSRMHHYRCDTHAFPTPVSVTASYWHHTITSLHSKAKWEAFLQNRYDALVSILQFANYPFLMLERLNEALG